MISIIYYLTSQRCTQLFEGLNLYIQKRLNWLRESGVLEETRAPLPQADVQLQDEAPLLLTWKRTSRHNGVQFFDITTSKSAPTLVCLGTALHTTTACNSSSRIWPHGSAPAALASLPFDPPEPQIIGKTQCFATFLPFRAPASSFLWLFLFSDLLSSSLLFSSLTLPTSAFPSVHIVRSLTSKLPSMILCLIVLSP